MATVSIILPTYNRAHTLKRAVDSVLAQTYTDFELIIIDDGSTDATSDVLSSFHDSRIKIVRHATNKGVAEARNTGVRSALGEFIAFQDSDDEWYPKKLERHMELFAHAPQTIGIIYSSFLREQSDGTTVAIPSNTVRHTSGNLHDALLDSNWITLQAAVVRKSCFDAIGFFDSELSILDDWEWILRASLRFEFNYIPETLVTTHYTEGNLTTQKERRMRDRTLLLQKHLDEYKKHPSTLARLASMIGGSFLRAHNKKEARQYYRLALQARPFTISALTGFLRSYL